MLHLYIAFLDTQSALHIAPQGGGNRLSLSESLTIHLTTRSKTLIHSNKYVIMTHAVEIILTLSTTFKGSADQQSVDSKTDFAFLGHENLFTQIYIT